MLKTDSIILLIIFYSNFKYSKVALFLQNQLNPSAINDLMY